MKIFFGADHGGLGLKDALVEYIGTKRPEVEVVDLGTYGEESVDYPDYGHKVSEQVLANEGALGILVCGTGIGISIAANRHKGIRAALVHNELTAKMAKAHNNANVLCLGGRVVSKELGAKLVGIWLDQEFEGGRHERRIGKL